MKFYAAVARKTLERASQAGWHPEEAVTRGQALKDVHCLAVICVEESKGSIEIAKLADFYILSADNMKIPEAEILKTPRT